MSDGFRLPDDAPGLSRRDALRLFQAGAAVLVGGCAPPDEDILPYVDMPEGMAPGEPMFYATSLPLGGFGRGFVVETREGRPIKVHGNELHHASLGATDVLSEAAVLDLLDPNRPRAPREGRNIATWSRFEAQLLSRLGRTGRGSRC